MLVRLPLLVAVAAAACDYTLPDGTCCSATNSEGPQTLLKAPATLLATDGLTADLRLDLQYRPHPNEAWQPLDKAALVATHGRDAHVFVVRDDFGSVVHVHGAWEDSEFILRNVPFASAGAHRVLASFAVDASVLNICVSESSVHAHPTDSDMWVHAATESEVELPGLETMTSSPWDVSRVQNATPSALVDGELTTAFATPRARLLSCPTGSEAIRLDLDASSTLELTQPRCTKLTWQVTAPLTPYLGAAAHVLIAKLNGALTHTHATLPERVTGDPCTAAFVGHFDDLDALPADLGHTIVGAAEFTEAGVYLVAAFFATGDDAVAAFTRCSWATRALLLQKLVPSAPSVSTSTWRATGGGSLRRRARLAFCASRRRSRRRSRRSRRRCPRRSRARRVDLTKGPATRTSSNSSGRSSLVCLWACSCATASVDAS